MDLNTGKRRQRELENKFKQLGIGADEIEERFIRSPGKGGQKVNKTSSCVYLKHSPTGIEVKYHRQRSQAMNRFRAYSLLLEKIRQRLSRQAAQEKMRIEKIKRQKRRRSSGAKEKMLREKKMRSEKKKLRAFRADLSQW